MVAVVVKTRKRHWKAPLELIFLKPGYGTSLLSSEFTYFSFCTIAQRHDGLDGAPGAPGPAGGRESVGGAPQAAESDTESSEEEQLETTVRTYFPETWLWDIVVTK